MKSLLWWTLSALGTSLSLFFLFLGVNLCRAAYQLDNPHHFILTFFASNLIILISVVFLAAVMVRIIARLRHREPRSGL